MSEDFFDKLKKGMDIPEEEPSIELTSASVDDSDKVIEEGASSKKKTTKKKTAKKDKKPKAPKKKKEADSTDKKSEEIVDDFFEASEGELTVDVFQKGKDLFVRSAIAGLDPEELDITIENDLVIIKGERGTEFKEEKDEYFFQECYWGKFKREIILPVEVDSSRAEAKMDKGILTIKMPIIENKGKTKVDIK